MEIIKITNTKVVPEHNEIEIEYQAADGELFETEIECVQHNKFIIGLDINKLKKLVDIKLLDEDGVCVGAYYINNEEEFFILCCYYDIDIPKKKKSIYDCDEDVYEDSGWYLVALNNGGDYSDYYHVRSLKNCQIAIYNFLSQFYHNLKECV